jgi:multidrug efflux system outer membrane protein
MTKKILILLAGASMLGGCNLAPKYIRPVGAAPERFPEGGTYPVARADAPADIALVGWREFFTDPRLVAVIETGLANNRDLRVAAANVLQARAQYRVQRADQLPTVTVSGSATYTNNPLGGGGGAGAGGVGGGTGVGPGTGTGVGGGAGGTGGAAGASSTDFSIYQVGAGFSSFELDLFGRLRNLSRAAQERYFASEEAARTTRISLIAEIGTAWTTMASDQEQLRIARETLKTFQQTLDLTRAQFRIGVASELESRQAETNFEGARNDVATLSTRIAQDQNALNLLVGATVLAEQLPGALAAEDVTRDALPADLSSAVLLKRPDVLQAEHLLMAQNANIGAARAAFFPQISLTGMVGTIGTALSGLFRSGSYTYTGAPSIGLPIFDGGRNRGNLEYARASQQAAVASYERAIQTAFREVADALAQRGTIGEQLDAQVRRAEAARVAARLSDARYRAGVDSFLTSLDAQRTAYAAQQQLANTRLARINNLIELYRSLGGGLQ